MALSVTRRSMLLGVRNKDNKYLYKFIEKYKYYLKKIGKEDFNLSSEESLEVITNLLIAFMNIDFKYDPQKGKFRNYLKKLFKNRARQLRYKRYRDYNKARGLKPPPHVPKDKSFADYFKEKDGEQLWKRENSYYEMYGEEEQKDLLEKHIDSNDISLDDVCSPQNIAKFLYKALDDIKDTMKPETFQIFTYVALEGVPVQEVADIYGITKNNVYFKKCHVKKKVKKRVLELLAIEEND